MDIIKTLKAPKGKVYRYSKIDINDNPIIIYAHALSVPNSIADKISSEITLIDETSEEYITYKEEQDKLGDVI